MDGPRATVETDVNSFTLTIRDAEDYPKYQLAVAEWALDLSQATVLPDYPIDFSSPLTTFTASGLNPGRRFQVCALCCVVLCCVVLCCCVLRDSRALTPFLIWLTALGHSQVQ